MLGGMIGPSIAEAAVITFRGPLFFGGATALQYVFQSLGLDVPYQLFLMLPYALTLLALVGAVGKVRAPADLGRAESQ